MRSDPITVVPAWRRGRAKAIPLPVAVAGKRELVKLGELAAGKMRGMIVG